jgi:hypothetical protein
MAIAYAPRCQWWRRTSSRRSSARAYGHFPVGGPYRGDAHPVLGKAERDTGTDSPVRVEMSTSTEPVISRASAQMSSPSSISSTSPGTSSRASMSCCSPSRRTRTRSGKNAASARPAVAEQKRPATRGQGPWVARGHQPLWPAADESCAKPYADLLRVVAAVTWAARQPALARRWLPWPGKAGPTIRLARPEDRQSCSEGAGPKSCEAGTRGPACGRRLTATSWRRGLRRS